MILLQEIVLRTDSAGESKFTKRDDQNHVIPASPSCSKRPSKRSTSVNLGFRWNERC